MHWTTESKQYDATQLGSNRLFENFTSYDRSSSFVLFNLRARRGDARHNGWFHLDLWSVCVEELYKLNRNLVEVVALVSVELTGCLLIRLVILLAYDHGIKILLLLCGKFWFWVQHWLLLHYHHHHYYN